MHEYIKYLRTECYVKTKQNKKYCFMYVWGVWGIETEQAPLTSGGSTHRDGREHWFSSDIQLSVMAPRPFLRHTLVIASVGGRNLVRDRSFPTTSSGRLGEDIGATKLSLGPLTEHDEDTTKQQYADWSRPRSTPHIKLEDSRAGAISVLLERKEPPDWQN